jgi:diacylglycerol kinase (ATP)
LLESQETICSPLHARLLVRKRALYTEDSTPLLVFVNSRSGGQQGIYLIKKFKRLLNPNQVVDLDIEGPIPALNLFQHHPNLRILCCGGDGTIGWVLSSLDKFPNIQPEVAVLPLGTGNDLARTLHWGGGYSEEKLSPILSKIERAIPVPLDRWVISTSVNKDGVEQEARHVMNNYFSIGVDAEVALAFHKLRMEAPALCSSRLGNKFWYLMNGIKTMIGKIPLIDQFIQVEVDGKNCWLDENIGAIIILNLPSYMGGADLWGPYNESEEFHRPSYNDRILELVAVTGSFHLVSLCTK